jgi:hypothetical protein
MGKILFVGFIDPTLEALILWHRFMLPTLKKSGLALCFKQIEW